MIVIIVNWTDFLHQIVSDLIGIVHRGESLLFGTQNFSRHQHCITFFKSYFIFKSFLNSLLGATCLYDEIFVSSAKGGSKNLRFQPHEILTFYFLEARKRIGEGRIQSLILERLTFRFPISDLWKGGSKKAKGKSQSLISENIDFPLLDFHFLEK